MKLHDSKWLAEKLGLSISTIERLRAEDSPDIPPAILIKNTIRYSEQYVDWWIQKRLDPNTPDYVAWCAKLNINADVSTDVVKTTGANQQSNSIKQSKIKLKRRSRENPTQKKH